MIIKMVATYLRRVYSSLAMHVLDIPPRLLSFLFFLLILIFPITRPSRSLMLVLTLAFTIALFAVSWDFLVRAGQLSLGHALFYGIGAYVTGLLHKYYELPLWATIPLAMVAAVFVALIIGFPCLRVKGPYLALITMVMPLIITGFIFYFKVVSGGENGISALPRFFPALNVSQRPYADYYLALAVLFVSAVAMYKIANSGMGIVLVSILDDELASKACGINVTKYKLMAFAISAFFGSLAGCLEAHFITAISPLGMFSTALSFTAVMIAMFGGLGTIYGPIAATLIMGILDDYILTRHVFYVPSAWHPLIFITIVVFLIVAWPRGVARFAVDKLEDLAEEREIEERGKRIWKKYRKKKTSGSTHGG